MSKVFTIVEGLENLGAMRTGGQGSVYKGRRQASIYTAVKLLPTPIHAETADDKNFRSFQNEVEKLQKVNEQASPYVVKILSSGLTESGSLPFIEMEYIEGPDLCELLQPPHPKVFPVREVIKVADQLAAALAHCHRVDVQHGDIKSNNVRYNTRSGNYVLLDFGLAVMSQEQRRTSMRHAGAIEFMAPEQNEGLMLPQTDVYSYGVVLYELLAGRVPFLLESHSETSRNAVMLKHMEAPVPDLVELRRSNLPDEWSDEQKQMEAAVPAWLLNVISTCLSKNPADRYKNGIALQEAVAQGSLATAANVVHSVAAIRNTVAPADVASAESVTTLQSENERLQSLMAQYQQDEVKMAALQAMVVRAGGTFNAAKGTFELKKSIVHIPAYLVVLMVTAMTVFVVLFARSAANRAPAMVATRTVSYTTALHSALPGIKPYVVKTADDEKKASDLKSAVKARKHIYPVRRKAKRKHHGIFSIFF